MPIRIAVAYTAEGLCRNKFFAERLAQRLKERGAVAEIVIIDDLCAADISADICVMRAANYDFSAQLAARGVRVFNDPIISLVCNDKFRTLSFVSARGIKVPSSALFDGTNVFPLVCNFFRKEQKGGGVNPSIRQETDGINPSIRQETDVINPSIRKETDGINPSIRQETDAINPRIKQDESGELGEWSFPLVAKSRFGHGGTQVFFCRDLRELRAAYAAIGEADIIIQKPMELGKDLRVYVMGGRIVAAVLRTSTADFRSNFSLGGSADIYSLSDKEKTLALAVCALLPPGFFGVDFLFDKGELILSEIEDVVGTRMLYSLGIADAAALYADYILDNK